MTVITILLGLAGLGVVVFFHELGHFIAARAVGVEVDEFSLGWGPKLVAVKRGNTVYRLSALPIGGYCRMKGDESYRRAIEEGLDEFPREPGSYFGAAPLKRVAIALGGPLMNILFAFAVFAAVNGAGYEVRSWGTRIVLASDFEPGSFAADAAGLRTGDELIAVNGKPLRSFADIQEAIALSADRELAIDIERDGLRQSLEARPVLDRESGAGRLGIYPWIDPIVASVAPGGAASIAGLRAGDRIVSVDGRPVSHGVELARYLEERRPSRLVIGYERAGRVEEASLILSYPQDGPAETGISWELQRYVVRSDGFLDALADGWRSTATTVSGTYRGLASLFRGVELLKAVSGPVRITWAVGQVAADGFSGGMATGLTVSFNFLAILSIGLFVMNLLPIPLLDGGWIVLFVVEALRGKAAKVKTVLRYQTVGFVAVAGLFLLTTLADILFFSGR